MIAMDQFLEYAEYVGNFLRHTQEVMWTKPWRRGRTLSWISRCRAPCRCAASGRHGAHLHRPSLAGRAGARLTGRGTDSPEKIQKRLVRAKVELQTADTYDYFVINDTVENAVREINAIMLAEHCRPSERMEILQ